MVGFRCCRVCGATSAGSRVQQGMRFRRIPDNDPCAMEGAHFAAEEAVHPPHARSHFLCPRHFARHLRLSAGDARVEVAAVAPGALPADRSCARCARMLLNQRGVAEYAEVADVCCGVMCGPCAGEALLSSLPHSMVCSRCNGEVRGWTVRGSGCHGPRRVDVPPLDGADVHASRQQQLVIGVEAGPATTEGGFGFGDGSSDSAPDHPGMTRRRKLPRRAARMHLPCFARAVQVECGYKPCQQTVGACRQRSIPYMAYDGTLDADGMARRVELDTVPPAANVGQHDAVEAMACLYNIVVGHMEAKGDGTPVTRTAPHALPDVPIIATGRLLVHPGQLLALEAHCLAWKYESILGISDVCTPDHSLCHELYDNTCAQHDPAVQRRSTARLDQPLHFAAFRRLPGAQSIINALEQLYPGLPIVYIDLLVQSKSSNAGSSFRMHQDTAPSSNKSGARLLITVVLVLSDVNVDETQMQVAGFDPTSYPAGRGGFCAFRSHAMHRSLPAQHEREIVKVVAFFASQDEQ